MVYCQIAAPGSRSSSEDDKIKIHTMLISSRLWIFLITICMETFVGKASKQKRNNVKYILCTENDSPPPPLSSNFRIGRFKCIYSCILVPLHARFLVNFVNMKHHYANLRFILNTGAEVCQQTFSSLSLFYITQLNMFNCLEW